MAIGTNLVAAWNFTTASGSTATDVVNGIIVTLSSGAAFSGGGLTLNAADALASVVAPSVLKITGGAITVAAYIDVLASPPNNVFFTEVSYNDPALNSSPFVAYGQFSRSGDWGIRSSDGTTLFTDDSLAVIPTANGQDVMTVISNAKRQQYVGGSSVFLDSTVRTAPVYTTTSQLRFGYTTNASGVTPAYRVRAAYIWNADKTADLAAFHADPGGTTWAFVSFTDDDAGWMPSPWPSDPTVSVW